ncbi:hypothetical protein MMC25_001806 [Agyrium rufum]|nr:hypothetical protein [Agyrium rufum]
MFSIKNGNGGNNTAQPASGQPYTQKNTGNQPSTDGCQQESGENQRKVANASTVPRDHPTNAAIQDYLNHSEPYSNFAVNGDPDSSPIRNMLAEFDANFATSGAGGGSGAHDPDQGPNL